MDSPQFENFTEKDEQACLKELKTFLWSNPSWVPFQPILNDSYLLHFIRAKKCNLEKVTKVLENYIEVRRVRHRDLFTSIIPSTCASIKSGTMAILKNKDRKGSAILVVRYEKWNPSEISVDDSNRGSILIGEEMTYFEAVHRNGFILIVDHKGFNWSHLNMLKNPFHIHRSLDIVMKGSALRYNAIHLVNMSFLSNLVFSVVHPFLPRKFRERIHCHTPGKTGLSKLHESIPVDILPVSLGGNLPEEEAWDKEFEQRIYAKEDYYKNYAASVDSKLFILLIIGRKAHFSSLFHHCS